MNQSNRILPCALALTVLFVLSFPVLLSANDPVEQSVVNLKDLPADAAELDRDLILARRQRDLLETLAQIAGLLEKVQPYRQPIMALLDENISQHDRWRVAVASTPPPVADGTGAQFQGQSDEVLQLRAEVESLRTEMALFVQAIPEMWNLPPPPENGSEDIPDVQETEWVPDRTGIRFVQLSEPGDNATGSAERSAVWLGDGETSAVVEEGRTIRFAGRLVRLAVLRPLADGRISIGLEVDGAPRTILW